MLNSRGISKRNLIGFLAFTGLVLSFQNCGQNLSSIKENSSLVASSDTGSNQKAPTTEKSIYDKLNVLEIPENPSLDESLSQTISGAMAKPENLFASKRLYVDPKSGQIKVVDQNEVEIQGVEFCMSEEDVSELQAILASAQMCSATEPSADQVCSQEFKYPYAKLHMDSDVVAVGESYSSCQRGPDLCGEYSALLKNFLSYIVVNLKSMQCQFESL